MSSNRSLKWEALSLLYNFVPCRAHSIQNWNSSVGVSIAANKNRKCWNIKHMKGNKIFTGGTYFLKQFFAFWLCDLLQLLTQTKRSIKFILEETRDDHHQAQSTQHKLSLLNTSCCISHSAGTGITKTGNSTYKTLIYS